MTLKYFLLFTIGFLIICNPLYSQGGPPMETDDPFTTDKGHVENNLGFTMEHNSEGNSFELPIEDLNYGLTKNIQLKYEVPLIVKQEKGNPTVAGIGKSNAGIKWKILSRPDSGISLAVYPQLLFNNSKVSEYKDITEAGTDFFLPVLVCRQFKNNSIGLEFGRLFNTENTGNWVYGVLYGREISEWFELAVEIFGNTEYSFRNDETVLNFGTRIKLNDKIKFLFSAGKSIFFSESDENDFDLYLGVQVVL